MMVNSIKGPSEINRSYEFKKSQGNQKAEEKQYSEEQAALLELGDTPKAKATYSKPVTKGLNADEISRLKEESQRAFSSLRQLVEGLLSKQGKKFNDVLSGKEILLVEEDTRAAAAQMISEDGELGVKAVSERIVAFAKAISGDDRSKAQELRNSIIEGFKAAEKIWGGELPEISQKTYDEVMRKMDEWEKG